MGYLEIRAPFNKLKVESAEDLWSNFMAYMNHSIDTPIVEPKIFNGKNGISHGNLDKQRPFTLNGFCNYLGIHPGTWNSWKKKEIATLEVDEKHCSFFLDVILQIESVIYDNQFQGAAVDIFNASIISRKLGLADKRDITSSDGSLKAREITPDMTPQEAAEAYADTLHSNEE